MEYLTEKEFSELKALLKQRQELIARHAKTPIDCYSLANKLNIIRDRKSELEALNDKIHAFKTA